MARFVKHDTIVCPFCKSVSENPLDSIPAEEKDSILDKLDNGALIQQAAPELSTSDRELLISGICMPCQDSFFGE